PCSENLYERRRKRTGDDQRHGRFSRRNAGSGGRKEYSHLRASFRATVGAARSRNRSNGNRPQKVSAESVSADARREELVCDGRIGIHFESLPEPHADDHDVVCAFVRLPDERIEARRDLAYPRRMVPGPGLEPGYSASKADVLPIRRSRNGCKRATYIMPQGAHEGQIGRVGEHLRASSVQRL